MNVIINSKMGVRYESREMEMDTSEIHRARLSLNQAHNYHSIKGVITHLILSEMFLLVNLCGFPTLRTSVLGL